MKESIGFLELNSIAQGIAAADAMLKAAEVSLVLASPNCPGKYNILIAGDVAAVNAAVEAGTRLGGAYVVDRLVIPHIHPQVIQAVNRAVMPEPLNAVGIIECFSITASVQVADQAVKAADVTLMDVRLGTGIGGKSFVVLTGDTSAVREATATGAASVQFGGMLIETVVIPNPSPEIFESLL